MYKRILTIFIVFFIFSIICLFLITFLKFDNYTTAYLFKKENYLHVYLDKKEFQKIENKKYLIFKLNKTTYESKILSYSYQDNICFLTLSESINEILEISKINLFINRSNLFGWVF